MKTNHPWFDMSLDVENRVAALVGDMTLREKIAQMLHKAPPIPRLGIPAYNWWNECLHGVARAGRATVFPQAIGMAAAFNEPLLFAVADAISDEARAKHHQALRQNNRGMYFGLTYWTPNINLFRDPRWGRGQETYGEDPYLTARLGVAFCKGLQGDNPTYLKLVATPKHYVVHSGPEPDRHSFDAIVNERDLRETYLPHFKACVQEGGAWSVMGAYNRTLGEPCCGSPRFLQKILREEWGFRGYVVSDCGAILDFHVHHKVTQSPAESAAMAVKNGCDLNCGEVYTALLDAVRQGLITEAEIDVSVKRLFEARIRLGMFDPETAVPYASLPPSVVRCPKHTDLARQMARESIVLLKNNGALPLSKDLNEIAVIGPNALSDIALYANYNGFSPQMVTPLDGILGKVSVGTQVNYHKGCDLWRDDPVPVDEIVWQARACSDAIVAVLGNTTELEGEEGGGAAASDGGGDRVAIGLPGRQLELLKLLHATGRPLILVLLSGSAIDLAEVEPYADAIVLAWYPGEQGGNAIADVLFGDYNPAGRLPVTFVKSMDQLPDFRDYAMKGRTYRFMEDEPLYRFGFGLSYTSFSYGKPSVNATSMSAAAPHPVTVSVDVKNVGQRDGDEVVQLYVSDVKATVPVPRHHLEGFQRIHLKAGETRTVIFTLTQEQWVCYTDEGQPMIEPGEFRLSVGGGQPDDPNGGATSTTLSWTA
ncbi:MAG: glycoside hydrolase family 3 C-terminal domain-containing protein [Lentisphaerae bacterium]|nr:glycoside hydrolase family 3 C-terminal domain-containing protein [Lentisphaerota bacterium]